MERSKAKSEAKTERESKKEFALTPGGICIAFSVLSQAQVYSLPLGSVRNIAF